MPSRKAYRPEHGIRHSNGSDNYQVYVHLHKKQITVGTFPTETQARIARKAARQLLSKLILQGIITEDKLEEFKQ